MFQIGITFPETNVPVQEIYALIAYAQKPPLNANADAPSDTRRQKFCSESLSTSILYVTRVQKTLANLRICAGSTEPSLLDNAIRIDPIGPNYGFKYINHSFV